jgi:phosphoribosyl 1,2-cyclic phosphodiesterase
VLLEADGARVLIDAGFPIRVLTRRLLSVGVHPREVEAVVLTHEHTDHVYGAAAGARRYGWRLYGSAGTLTSAQQLAESPRQVIRVGDVLGLSTMEIATIPVLHDAAAPVAVVATACRTGVRTAVAYDLGCATDSVRRGLSRVDVMILESNHDEGMLRAGPYPPSVVERIASRRGHLSNRAAGDLMCEVAHSRLTRVVLAHISQNCNDPVVAGRSMRTALRRAGHAHVNVSITSQDAVAGPFGPDNGAALQLGLEL